MCIHFGECSSTKGQDSETQEKNPIIVMVTNQGVVEIELFPEVAPKSCQNMMGLAEKGYYDGGSL